MKPATARATIRDVAILAGVSVGTVSNVLNRQDLVSDDTADRVRVAIDKLGFVRNDIAHQLRAQHSSSVGFVALDIGNPFFLGVERGADRQAAREGLSLLIANSDFDRARQERHLDTFERHRVRGILLSSLGDSGQRLDQLRLRGISAVLIGGHASGRTPSVGVDDIAGGRLAVEHLISRGCRNIMFVGGPSPLQQVTDRLAGSREAMAAYPEVALRTLPTAGHTVVDGRQAGAVIRSLSTTERPDGIFAVNDLVGAGLIDSLNADTRLVPDSIAIVGYDDITFPVPSLISLTSIRQPAELIGETAMRILLDEDSDTDAARQIRFSPTLVERESTRMSTLRLMP